MTPLRHDNTETPEEVGFSGPRLKALADGLARMVYQDRFVGISVNVSRHGRVVSRETTGLRSPDSGEPLREDAIFRIASMTKPVIGVAMMLLYEEGRWQLDDPIERFLPALAQLRVLEPDGRLVAPDHAPTMRELVTNTTGICGSASVAGGLRNGVGAEVRRRYVEAGFQEGTLADMVDTIATLPLSGHPGRRFQYGLSQDVQGRMIEVLSGLPLDEFLRERVFAPLGMHDTGFVVRAEDTGRVVPMVTYGPDGSFEPAEPDQGAFPKFIADAGAGIPPRFLSGGGGLLSKLPDYTAFAEMLLHGGRGPDGVRLLAPGTVALMAGDMLPPGVTLDFNRKWEGCGYGVDVGVILDPARASHMGGPVGRGTFHWNGAHGTFFWVDPENDLTVVGMTNLLYSGIVSMGWPHPAPDLRAFTRSLVYQALTEPGR